MNKSIGHIIVAVSVIAGALIVSFDDLSRTAGRNIIPLEGGAIRLGTVYKEQVDISAELISDESGYVIHSASSGTYDTSKKLHEKLTKDVDAYNENKSDDKSLTMDTIAFTDPASLELTGSITYQSEHFPEFTLVVSEQTTDVADRTSYTGIVDEVEEFEERVRPDMKAKRILN